jgi:hypothetical protein
MQTRLVFGFVLVLALLTTLTMPAFADGPTPQATPAKSGSGGERSKPVVEKFDKTVDGSTIESVEPNHAQGVQTVLSISVDKGPGATYRLGERIRVCYTVPRPDYMRILKTTSQGQTVWQQWYDDGTGWCLNGTVGAPTGEHRLTIQMLNGGWPTGEQAEVSFFAGSAAPIPAVPMRPLHFFYCEGCNPNVFRSDGFHTASNFGLQRAISMGYEYYGVKAQVLATWQPGTIPLKLYWQPQTNDHVTVATVASENMVRTRGYQFLSTEGYVYTTQQLDTIPLYLVDDVGISGLDVWTRLPQPGERGQFIRIEGYARR